MIGQAIRTQFGLEFDAFDDVSIGQGQTERFRFNAGGRSFIAKHCGVSSDDGMRWTEFECRMLEHLLAEGLPVSRPIQTSSGGRFAVVDGRPLMLFQWIDGGIEWPSSRVNAKKLGSALARMHISLNSLELLGHERRYDIDRLVDRPLRMLEPYATAQEETFSVLKLAIDSIRAKIAATPINADTFGPIHGGIHQGNCVFGDEGAVAVFDFALCGVGYRAYDLTGYLWPMRDRTIHDPALRDSCDGFLEGYCEIRPLVSEEVAAIGAFVNVRTLWETGDWLDTGTGASQPDEVRKTIPYILSQFSEAGS